MEMHPLGLFIFQASSLLLFLWVQVLWACQEIKRPFLAAEAILQHLPCPEGRKTMLKERKKKTPQLLAVCWCV